MKTLLPVLAVAVLAVGGCTSKSENSTTAAGNVADLSPEGPSLTAKLFGGGKAMPLDQQKILVSGAVVTLTSLQAKADETVVGIRVNNASERDVKLDWSDHKTYLLAGGQKHWLTPPVDNPDVLVARGAKMEGELVFAGAIPKGSTITFVVNEGMSDAEYTDTPGFSIPLQATEAAWSDDGSKKKSVA